MPSRVDALDGIRGLALVAVLAFHTGPGSFPGGFLGVEIFFVLSGYLLTSLLLREHEHSGRIDHLRYAARRVRRLVPAGLVLLTALLLLAPLAAPEDAHRLRGDLLYSLGGLTNWHLIADGSSYFDAVGRPPFVRHLWSLAVEIQFCLVCSVLAAWLARRSRRMAAIGLGGAMTVCAVAMGVLYRAPDPSRAYYGSDTRFGALFAGALLAVILTSRPSERVTLRVHKLVVPALVVLGGLVLFASEQSRVLYPAGFLVTQAATAVLIIAGQSGGVAAHVLASRPLR
jgi:peptidoglycan/LPS O-acetylase OafA/YrhL